MTTRVAILTAGVCTQHLSLVDRWLLADRHGVWMPLIYNNPWISQWYRRREALLNFFAAKRRSITSNGDGDEAVGVQIVRRALEFPTRRLAENAGQEGAVIVQEVKKRSGSEGFNVAAGEYEDLMKAGVVDPTKVTRTALQNAASISALLLTTEALMTELPEKEKPGPVGPGGMGGMDY